MSRYIIPIMLAVLFLLTSCDNPVDSDDEHAEAEGLVLVDAGDTILTVQNAQVSDTLEVVLDEAVRIYEVIFLDGDGDQIAEEEFDDDFSLGWTVSNESVLSATQASRWSIEIAGLQADTTALVLQLLHLGHPDFTTPEIVTVVR